MSLWSIPHLSTDCAYICLYLSYCLYNAVTWQTHSQAGASSFGATYPQDSRKCRHEVLQPFLHFVNLCKSEDEVHQCPDPRQWSRCVTPVRDPRLTECRLQIYRNRHRPLTRDVEEYAIIPKAYSKRFQYVQTET